MTKTLMQTGDMDLRAADITSKTANILEQLGVDAENGPDRLNNVVGFVSLDGGGDVWTDPTDVPSEVPYCGLVRAAIHQAILEMKDACVKRWNMDHDSLNLGSDLGKIVVALGEGRLNKDKVAEGLDHTTDLAHREAAVELAKVLLEWALSARHESLLHQALHSLTVWGVKF